MQNPGMAAALGVPTERVYALTFAVGAAVSGLAGGADGAVLGRRADDGRGLYRQGLHHRHHRRRGDAGRHRFGLGPARRGQHHRHLAFTPVLGEVLLLGVAIVLLRLLPQGITGRFFRRAL